MRTVGRTVEPVSGSGKKPAKTQPKAQAKAKAKAEKDKE